MNENLNLVELLKDCPKGTKFYSRCLGSVEFCKITLDNYIEVIGKNGYYIGFKPNGTYQHSEETAEIDLFPSKDQRDWSKWHRPFVNGDIVFYNDTIAIFKEWGDETLFRTYVAKGLNCEDLIGINTPLFGKSVRNEIRFATEEEKQILFKALEENGYKWNPETKTLKNWTIQDAKDGDVIFYDDGWTCIFKCIHGIWYSSYCFITSDGEFHTGYEEHAIDSKINGNAHIATKEQRDFLFQKIKEAGYRWNTETKILEKLIVPKFKVGDSIQSKTDNNDKFTITNIDNDKFYYGCRKRYEFMIPVAKQDNWELVPNKTTKDMEEKKINQMSLANCDLDEVEIVLGDRFELKIIDGKYYAVRKKPIYPTTYEEDNYCETLEIKVLGYKVGDVVFTNHAGWIKITNKLWDCYAKEHVYEGIGVLNEQEYDNISHKDIINKMETDSVIENMKESITPSPYITANITDKNNYDIECPDGYEFHDENGNLIGNKVIMIPKKPKYPTTYAECCKVIGYGGIISFAGLADEEENLYENFIVLKRCRDAYWKIAGEQMRLGEPWKSKNELSTRNKIYDIRTYCNNIEKGCTEYPTNRLLSFPTEEMRDVFYENFKDLIENCKELL